MNAETAIGALERFFLDIIGTIIPGGLLLGGLWYIAGAPSLRGLPFQEDWMWVSVLALSYMAGHLLTSLSRPVQAIVGWVSSYLRRIPKLGKSVPRHIDRGKSLQENIADGSDFKGFVRAASKWFPEFLDGGPAVVHPARNIALSLVPEHQARVFRFMFLSLFNFGVATSLILIVLVWELLFLLHSWNFSVVRNSMPIQPMWAWLWMVVSLFFLERGYYFQDIAIRAPFSMGSVAVLQGALESQQASQQGEPPRSLGTRIYLAGGFYSGWQDRVAEAWAGEVIDPREHRLRGEKQFTLWDLEAIRNSDILLGYLEPANPGGYALALELGYAKALGKRVILVDEKSKEEPRLRRYFAMLWASADLTFDDLDDALSFLGTFSFVRKIQPADKGA